MFKNNKNLLYFLSSKLHCFLYSDENNRRQQDAQRIVYQNLADIGNAAINVCEPIQESVYVNVAEYASIQRKQVPDIVEENEDITNEVVEVKESVKHKNYSK
jgi:hypothetical protein